MLEEIIEIINKDFNPKNYKSANEIEKDLFNYLREMNRQILWYKLQIEIESKEKELMLSDKSLESVNFQTITIFTIYGEIELRRRYFKGKGTLIDKIMNINDFLSMASKLGTIFSINDSFDNSRQEFEEFTGNKLSTPTLQKHVEKIGTELSGQFIKEAQEAKEVKLKSFGVLTDCVKNKTEKIIYVGGDGTGVPMRTGGTQEAKVGIVFKEDDIWKLSEKRNQIVKRQYLATLSDADGFMDLLWGAYVKVAKDNNYKVVCLGDGAHWLWIRFSELFPDRIEILDFFHLSEYVWDVAKACFPNNKTEAEAWVSIQLKRLKNSESKFLLEELKFLNKKYRKESIKDEIEKLQTYLENNKGRIDYKSYLEAGLMIGSGVVESSNKVVVTKRMKQGGMHWSQYGAQSIMSLRALYCSSRQQWQEFWNLKCA